MASNTLLTPTMITREAIMILHQKLNFVGGVNKQYDDRFADSGGKIGDTINIRMPSKYVVRNGATLSPQNHVQRSTPLSVQTQQGVDVSFTSKELTLDMEDFRERHLEPAMAQLAAHIEGSTFDAAYQKIPNYTNATTNSLATYKYVQQVGAKITNELGPASQRMLHMDPDSQVEFMDAVKGLFQSSDNIRAQYREGMVGRTAGFDVFENTLTPSHTTGSLAGTPLTDGANLGTSDTSNVWPSAGTTDLSVNGATSGTTLKAGDIITLGTQGAGGIYDVHPEYKSVRGKLKTFVVQSDVTLTTAATAYTVTVRPPVIYGSGNAYQNCALSTITDTDDVTVTLVGAVSSAFGQDIGCHRDAFVFATVDLEDVSDSGAWGARENYDGISMRVAKQYDITNDAFPCRIDVMWGFAPLYSELAARHMYEKDLL